MTDTDPVSWRIYRHEWITVQTTFAHDGQSPLEQATDFFTAHYADRIRVTDMRLLFDNDSYDKPAVLLQLRLPNLRGEFKTRRAADEFRTRMFGTNEDVSVVGADTDDDHDLRNYGVKKLPEQLHDRIAVESEAADSVDPT